MYGTNQICQILNKIFFYIIQPAISQNYGVFQ